MVRTQISFYQQDKSKFLIYLKNLDHLVDTKTNFLVGSVRVILNNHIYESELYSSSCFDQQTEWDTAYFKALDSSLSKFIIESKKTELQEELYLIIKYKQNVLIKAKLKQMFGKERLEIIMDYFGKYLEQQRQKNTSQQIQIQSQKEIMRVKLIKLETLQKQSEQKKQNLLKKLSAIYKEKIKKLKEINEDLSDDEMSQSEKSSKNFEAQEIQNMNYGASLFMPSQAYRF